MCKFKFFLFLLLASAHAENTGDVECTFTRTFFNNQELYCCHVYTLASSNISKIVGKHFEDKKDTDVTAVFMNNLEIDDFPRGFENFFPNLVSLEISRTNLSKLSKSDLGLFPKLQRLVLMGNQLTKLDGDVLESNNELLYIDLSENKENGLMEKIFKTKSAKNCPTCPRCPKSIDSGASSKKIQMENTKLKQKIAAVELENHKLKNQLKILVPENEKLKKKLETKKDSDDPDNKIVCESASKKIFCEVNEFSCFPKDLTIITKDVQLDGVQSSPGSTSAKNMKELKIFNQNVNFLPTNLAKLFPVLEKLFIVKSELKDVSSTELKNLFLDALTISHNDLKKIHGETFTSQRNLESLDLSMNRISDLDLTAFSGLERLKTLNLNGNRLKKLEKKVFENLEGLKHLFLSRNMLEVVPASLFNGKNLNLADFTKNTCIDLQFPKKPLGVIKQSLESQCSGPLTVKCQVKNKNCKAQDFVVEAPGLTVSEVNGKSMPDGALENVETLQIIDQTVNFIPIRLCESFPSLTTFLLHNSQLTKIGAKDFECLDSLLVVMISNNDISEIEEGAFDHLTRLKRIYLKSNKIKSLPSRAFQKNKRLISVNLSDNLLKHLRGDLFPETTLIAELRFENNRLTYIDSNLLWLFENKKMVFTGNVCTDQKFEKGDNFSDFFMKVQRMCQTL